MFDIRYASKADLDRLNEEARAWKQRQQHPKIHPKGEEVNQPEPQETQLELPIT